MNRKFRFPKYFFSYLVIGVIPLLFGIILYYTNIPALEREIERSHIAAMDQAVREMDYITREMTNIARHFSGYLENLTDALPIPVHEINIPQDILIYRQIQFYEETLNFPATIALFPRGESWLYTSQGRVAFIDFEADVINEGHLAMSSFYARISRARTVSSLRFSQDPFTGNPVNAGIAYLYPLPYMDSMPRATLYFIFQYSDIQKIFENYLGDIQGDITLFNDLLVPLFNYSSIILPESFRAALSGIRGVGIQEQRIHGNRNILVRLVSESTGLSLVHVMRDRDFYFGIQGTRLILVFSTALLGIMVVIFAMVLSKRNYQPIRRLLNNIGGPGWENSKPVQENEFDFIQNRVNTIEEANQELSHTLDRQRPMLVYSCLRSLISGEYNTIDEMHYYLRNATIDLSKPWFFALIIIPGLGDDSAGKKMPLNSRIQTIQAIAEANNCDLCRLYCMELIPDQHVAVIVNAAEKRVGGEDIRRFITRLLTDQAREKYEMEPKICSGQLYDSPVKIQASFLEAKTVMADHLLWPENTVFFEEWISRGDTGYRYPIIEQSLYIQSVKQANITAALKAIDAMIDKAVESGVVPVTQCLCFDIINTMMKVSGELKTELSLNELKAFTGFTDIEHFRVIARSLTEEICRNSMKLHKEKADLLKSKIIAYVNENYYSTQFSLQEVADHLGLGVSYLSHFFKQETGSNFIDYVSMLRLDRAKDLLVSTDKQIKEIVFNIGYMDTASFIRKFRAKEGITPNQYRERMRQ